MWESHDSDGLFNNMIHDNSDIAWLQIFDCVVFEIWTYSGLLFEISVEQIFHSYEKITFTGF